MTSENSYLAIELTQSILEKLWQHDISLLMKYIDEDFTLTDALHHNLLQGQDEVCSFIDVSVSGMIKSRMSNRRFIVAQNCGSACTIIRQYELSPVDADVSDEPLPLAQFCVFVWELSKKGDLRLKHIGVTKPDCNLSHGSIRSCYFPAGRQDPGQSARNSDRMVITDLNDCMRFVPKDDIVYATSDGRNSQLYCFSGVINARLSISSFIEQAGEKFIPIHRCYAINLEHITYLKPYCVGMADGSEIPVPSKRYSEIKQKLTELVTSK